MRFDFQKLILNRWRRCLKKKIVQKSIAKADIFRQKAVKNSLHNIFHEWILFSNKQKSISRSLNNLQEVSNKDLLKNFIHRWSNKYHSAENIVRAIDHTSRIRLMRTSFSEWRIKTIERRDNRFSLDIVNQKASISRFRF
jgi:hypothetical protein